MKHTYSCLGHKARQSTLVSLNLILRQCAQERQALALTLQVLILFACPPPPPPPPPPHTQAVEKANEIIAGLDPQSIGAIVEVMEVQGASKVVCVCVFTCVCACHRLTVYVCVCVLGDRGMAHGSRVQSVQWRSWSLAGGEGS